MGHPPFVLRMRPEKQRQRRLRFVVSQVSKPRRPGAPSDCSEGKKGKNNREDKSRSLGSAQPPQRRRPVAGDPGEKHFARDDNPVSDEGLWLPALAPVTTPPTKTCRWGPR